MKGFKSFADNTVLEFEPGVTAVVGPNGSGKSNVVDAVTWVLGAQSTRALRSAKMDDVIFAGTLQRAALGRAEVALTLDNSSGRLPVDGAEVTISRTLFRNGESEYAINGTTCRLLDIQELLSDSGVGRQQHMIIGQGQLDSILNSSAENRRAVIEEAAGVLKHRRRKERAERRLAATQENLERLGDLVREVRRQMRPLERQAASARSYADVERELREARQVLFAHRLEAFESRRVALETSIADAADLERSLRGELATLDAQASSAAAEMASRREEMLASTLGTLQGLSERARGTLSVIAERERSLRAALQASADENVIATLEADAARLAGDLALVEVDESALRELRVALESAREAYETRQAAHDAAYDGVNLDGDETARRNALERLASLERSLAASRDAEARSERRVQELDVALAASDEAQAQASALCEGLAQAALQREAELDEVRHRAESAEREVAEADAHFAETSDRAARAQARAEALARALEELSGAEGRAMVGRLEGVLGAFLDLIEVEEGWERAVESAAGASAGAVVADGPRSAQAALETLRREGGTGLILPAATTVGDAVEVPEGCRAVRDLVRPREGAPDHVTRVLDALFARAVVAESWQEGIDVAVARPELVIVTRDGDRFAASGWRVASGRALVTRSTVEEAETRAREAQGELGPARERRDAAAQAAQAARRAVHEAMSSSSQATTALDRATRDEEAIIRRRGEDEARREPLERELATAREQRETLEAELEELAARLPDLEAAVADAQSRREHFEASRREVDELRVLAQRAESDFARRDAEVGERRRLIESRRAEIEVRLEGRSREREAAARRREALESDLAVLARLSAIVESAAQDIRLSQEAMDSTYREQLEASRASAERLESLRRSRHGVDERLAAIAEGAHRAQIEHAELAVMASNLHEAIRRDLGVEPHELTPAASELDDAHLEEVVGELEARMSSLGPINPLALEELAALEERYQELDAQVADVRHARRELQEVVRALDEEIMSTFSSAVADVNEHFSTLIAMLFPGGQGRLLLTEPDDPLNTGVEIEVRPMGRNVRRISLLSGGERSMAALAFLFAVFRSRPSPFYMMDEVEAALDDVNLQRFLNLVDEFRHEAQLLIVTHQKRTMESADALYGVTMVPGASSKVVSQRVNRSREEVSA